MFSLRAAVYPHGMPERELFNPVPQQLVLAIILLCGSCVAFAQTNSENAPGAEAPVASALPSSDGASPATPAAATASSGNFFHRLAKAYADDWKAAPSTDAGPKFRGTPSPVDRKS